MIEQRDARVHRFQPGAFDVAIGRSGVMFVADPVAAFAKSPPRSVPTAGWGSGAGRTSSDSGRLMATAGSVRQHVAMPDLGPPGVGHRPAMAFATTETTAPRAKPATVPTTKSPAPAGN